MYFEENGAKNTGETIRLALAAAAEQDIRSIVVASVTGRTATLLAGAGKKIVCVTHAYGFATPGGNEMPAGEREKLAAAGIAVLTTTHVLSGVERGVSTKSGGMYPAEIMSDTLRMFGQGMKVCVEIAVMALDAGLIPYGEKIVAIGGTGRGADTAAILTPAHAREIFNTRIHEIVCKPR